MKRKNLLILCMTAIVTTALYAMNRDDESPDADLANLQIGSPGQEAQQVRRSPLAPMNRNTPTRAIIPIEGDETRPGTPLRATPGAANALTAATTDDLILELRRRVAAGDMTPTQLTRQLRFLDRLPTPRADAENTGPQTPSPALQNQNINQN